MNFNRSQPFVALGAFLCLAAGIGLACPFGSPSVLHARASALAAPVAGDFFVAARRLLATHPAYPVSAQTPGAKLTTFDAIREHAEAEGLSARQATLLKQMRAAPDGDAAYALGAGLPEAIRLYTAGARDFALAQQQLNPACPDDAAPPPPQAPTAPLRALPGLRAPCAQLARPAPASAQAALQRAERRFAAVLALPKAASSARATWAAYSLGRVYRLAGLREARANTQAIAAFVRTRALVDQGLPDPLALAYSSFGEEAAAHLALEQVPQAIERYAAQAVPEGDGPASLSMLARALLRDPALLGRHIRVPIVQRLCADFIVAYGDEAEYLGLASAIAPAEAPAAPGKGGARARVLLTALAQAGVTQPVEGDTLGALAYAAGRYPEASRFVAHADTALGHWIRAKLALRQGQREDAAAEYSAALQRLRADEGKLSASALQRLRAEQGILTLSRGDYLQAFAQFYSARATYWPDVAYIAERVLTTAELKDFVDAQVPATPLASQSGASVGEWYALRDPDTEGYGFSPDTQLRDLLARRLMREGRFDEALGYFHLPGDLRFRDPLARSHARAYITALRTAQHAWTRIGQAQARLEAARLLRSHGMAIMGTELDPDDFMTDGGFPADMPPPSTKDLSSPGELARYQRSAVQPDARLHYRYLAADLARQAADDLPHRSQAYAATLCHAASWLIDRDPPAAQVYYQQYLSSGPRVPWASHFGRSCPPPAFASAYLTTLHDQARAWRRTLGPYKPVLFPALGVLGLAAALGFAFVLRRKRLA